MWFKFEEAVRILISYFPEEGMKKPTLYHSIRVGVYLWNNGYSEEIQIAWLLHDALEDTDIPEIVISDNFWTDVLDIVKANSKNKKLDKSEVLEDIVKRCYECGENAMIVKMADVYDNFLFYVKENNVPEIERCKTLASLIRKYKKDEWSDSIFDNISIIHAWCIE